MAASTTSNQISAKSNIVRKIPQTRQNATDLKRHDRNDKTKEIQTVTIGTAKPNRSIPVQTSPSESNRVQVSPSEPK